MIYIFGGEGGSAEKTITLFMNDPYLIDLFFNMLIEWVHIIQKKCLYQFLKPAPDKKFVSSPLITVLPVGFVSWDYGCTFGSQI